MITDTKEFKDALRLFRFAPPDSQSHQLKALTDIINNHHFVRLQIAAFLMSGFQTHKDFKQAAALHAEIGEAGFDGLVGDLLEYVQPLQTLYDLGHSIAGTPGVFDYEVSENSGAIYCEMVIANNGTYPDKAHFMQSIKRLALDFFAHSGDEYKDALEEAFKEVV